MANKLDLLGALCDSELDCNFPVGLPKKSKTAKKEPPTPPQGGVPFWHFFFMEVFFSGGKPTGKLLELELPIIWELIVQYEAACSPNHVSGQVMPDASML